jgi:hypothetical protein
MAGFVAYLDQWEYAEPKLDAILNGFGVPILHAREFEATKLLQGLEETQKTKHGGRAFLRNP